MDATRSSSPISRYAAETNTAPVAAATPQYGVPSWLYVMFTSLVTAGFFVTQLLVNNVRNGVLSTSLLDEWMFHGAYWWVATTGMAFLLLSGLLAGVTPAILVVRTFLHSGACKRYVALLMFQGAAWGYFLSVIFG